MTLSPPEAARWRGGGGRFAHLIESDGPGGAERMLASVATELQSAGSYNLVLVPAGGEGWLARELNGTGVQVETYRLDRPFSPHFAKWLAGVFRKHRIMLAHSHEFSMAVYGTWAARLAGGGGGRTAHLFTMHGTRYYAERLRRRLALRAACLFSSAAVCVSRQLARSLAHDLWIRPSRIVTVPNGVRPPVATQSSLRAELGLASTDRLLVAVGNLYPVKGHRYLLEAFARLAPQHPELHVAIAGRGELEEPLRARARELQVGDRFHLLGLRSDIANVLAGADIFVLPSLSEGVPLALLEAMLAGRPVVATSVGEVPIVLDGGRAGLLVQSEDATALATAVSSLLSDPALARRFAAVAYQRATERYTLDAMMEGYLTLYARALWNQSYDARPERVRDDERQPLPHRGTPGERALMR